MSTGFVPYTPRGNWHPMMQPTPPGLTVVLGGLEFISGARPKSRISISEWDGWTNGANRSGGPVAHEYADGGIEGEVYEGGRSIRFEGLIAEPNVRALWERMERFGQVLTAPRWDWLKVRERHLGLERQIRVTRVDRPMITPVSDRLAVYTLELRSAAFARLSATESNLVLSPGGTGAISNVGTYPADLTLELVGPLTNPGFTWGARSWDFKGTIAAGTRITVNMTTREVKNPVTGVLMRKSASGEWIKAQPGTRNVTMTGAGSGTGTWTWRSAWS